MLNSALLSRRRKAIVAFEVWQRREPAQSYIYLPAVTLPASPPKPGTATAMVGVRSSRRRRVRPM